MSGEVGRVSGYILLGAGCFYEVYESCLPYFFAVTI